MSACSWRHTFVCYEQGLDLLRSVDCGLTFKNSKPMKHKRI